MVGREFFLETIPPSFPAKLDALSFESGPKSLTQATLNRELRPVVVGANGAVYDIDRWPSSETFPPWQATQSLDLGQSDPRIRRNERGQEAAVHSDVVWRGPEEGALAS